MAFALTMLLSGACYRGNGLPQELQRHLLAQGIQITPSRVHAPTSSRGGYIVLKPQPGMASRIVATFHLQPIPPEDRRWDFALDRAGRPAAPKQLWGASGRPAQFKLSSGGQFEYFYLLVTEDGWVYLVAEYAYG